MTFVDHLQGQKLDDKYLEVAFGDHVITGDLAKSVVVGASPTHQVTVQHLLGEAYGRGWFGPKAVWFRGTNRDSSKYKFYPGTYAPAPVLQTYTADSSTDKLTCSSHGYNDGDQIILMPGSLPAPLSAGILFYVRDKTTNDFKLSAVSGGSAIDLTSNGSGTLQMYKNDATQGIDTVFDKDNAHSGTAWIRVLCPNGSEVGIPDIDTKNNPPTGMTGIFSCQLGDRYNSSGSVSSSNIILNNPATVITFGLKEIRKYDNSRIDFASLDTLYTACHATLTPDYTTLPQGVGLTGTYYNSTNFTSKLTSRTDPVIQYDLSTGTPELGQSGTGFCVSWEGKIRFKYGETYTLTLIHNDSGKLWIDNLTTALIDEAAAGTHTATFTPTADAYYNVKLEWVNSSGNSEYRFDWQSASQAKQVVPQDRLYPKAVAVRRFACHMAFTQPSNLDDFLRSVLFTCNGGYQDVDGKLKFFIIDDLSSSFAFTEANIVKDSFSFKPRYSQQELKNLPNRYIADGRDRESRYFEKFDPPLIYDLADLQDIAGRVIEQIIYVGNTIRWQGLTNLAHYAKVKTSQMTCEFVGLAKTMAVMPGDKVTMTHSLPGWTTKQFLCIEASDVSPSNTTDLRRFKLLEWS